MELKINIAYEQVLDIIRQLPADQLTRLMTDMKYMLEPEKTPQDVSSFQAFLLKGPIMSDEQYDTYVENRKNFSQWRGK